MQAVYLWKTGYKVHIFRMLRHLNALTFLNFIVDKELRNGAILPAIGMQCTF